MSAVRAAGFPTEPAGGGRVRIERDGVACIAEPGDGGLSTHYGSRGSRDG